MKTKPLPIELLVTDAGTQSRLSIHDETVGVYAELIEDSGNEWPFPPVDVFHDGNRYMVADGFHRVLGAAKTKRASIPCIVHKGTATDARIFAMTANDRHGLRMSRADKRACVEWLLDNKKGEPQVKIAEMAGVTSRYVRLIIAERNGKKRNSSGPSGGSVNSSGEDAGTDSTGTEPQETAPEPPRNGLNADPIANPDPFYFTSENTVLSVGTSDITLLDNDWDPEASALTASTDQPGELLEGATNSEWEEVEDGIDQFNESPRVPPPLAESGDTSIILDSLGREVPAKFIDAHGLSATIQVQGRKLDAILRELKSLSEQAGGEFIPTSRLDIAFGDLKGEIFGSCYWSECPKCEGAGESCYDCNNNGWWPKRKSGHLSAADKALMGIE